MRSRFEVILKKDYTRVHDASLKILKETGIVFHSEEVLDILKRNGIKILGRTAYFDEKTIEDSLLRCPEKFKWLARDVKRSVVVGGGFLVQPNVGPVFIQDLDHGRRKAKREDYVKIQKLCQHSDVVDIVGSIPVDPSDMDPGTKHIHMMYEILKNTDKPVSGFCGHLKQVREQFDLLEIALGGRKATPGNHCMAVLVNPLSPLSYAPDTLDTMMEYARRGQPVLLAPCISAGVTGPVSLFGTAVLQNTEILAGIALLQLIHPGTPVVYSVASSTAFMKTAAYSAGTPEAMMINAAGLQMGLDFYHLPTRTMCGITNSKEVDCQAGFETMQSLLLGMMSGAHIAVQCLGVLDAIMTTSYEKFIIDEELIRRVKRIKAGVDTSQEALAVDVIQEVGHEASYLMHDSTLDHFRDLWTPQVSDWNSYSSWVEEGSESMERRANARFKKILDTVPESLIDAELDKELKDYITHMEKQ